MDAQQYPGARHADRNRHRNPRETRTCPWRTIPSDDQGQGGEGRCRSGRMPARKRRRSQQSQGTHVRPHPVDRELDRVRDRELTSDHEREKQRDRRTTTLLPPEDGAGRGDRNDDGSGPELGEELEPLEGRARHTRGGPAFDALIDADDTGVGPDHVHHETHHHAGHHDQEQRNREREPSGCCWVEP